MHNGLIHSIQTIPPSPQQTNLREIKTRKIFKPQRTENELYCKALRRETLFDLYDMQPRTGIKRLLKRLSFIKARLHANTVETLPRTLYARFSCEERFYTKVIFNRLKNQTSCCIAIN